MTKDSEMVNDNPPVGTRVKHTTDSRVRGVIEEYEFPDRLGRIFMRGDDGTGNWFLPFHLAVDKEAEPSGPYRVEVDPHNPGCPHCGAGKCWWIVDADGVGSGKSWGSEDDCQEDCDTLNMAYQAGWDGAMDALPTEEQH